jgi:hypothetical protein
VKVNLDAEISSDDDSAFSSEESYYYESGGRSKPRTKKIKKAARPQASRPAYGRFRAIEELDCNASDEDDTYIRKHRDICEKCHRDPAHKLIEALKKSSKVKGRTRKRTPSDEFEESGHEEETFIALGGWVRW